MPAFSVKQRMQLQPYNHTVIHTIAIGSYSHAVKHSKLPSTPTGGYGSYHNSTIKQFNKPKPASDANISGKFV